MIALWLFCGLLALYLLGKDHIPPRTIAQLFNQRLWTSVFSSARNSSIVVHYVVVSLVIFALSKGFHLSNQHTLVLILLCWFGLPLVLYYQLKYQYYANEFHQCTLFLQHFLAHFKTHQKTLIAYLESKEYVDGSLKGVLDQMIDSMESSGSVEASFDIFVDKFPHFIVKNIQTFICSCEMFGSLGSSEAIELLEDDIDDWIEDTMLWIEDKKRMKHRMILLSMMSCVIAMLNQSMLTSFFDLHQFAIYHDAMTAFLLTVLLTCVMGFRLLSGRWILLGEQL